MWHSATFTGQNAFPLASCKHVHSAQEFTIMVPALDAVRQLNGMEEVVNNIPWSNNFFNAKENHQTISNTLTALLCSNNACLTCLKKLAMSNLRQMLLCWFSALKGVQKAFHADPFCNFWQLQPSPTPQFSPPPPPKKKKKKNDSLPLALST